MYNKHMNKEKKATENSSPFKQTYRLSFENTNLKVHDHTGGKWFIHGPRRKENPLLSLQHSCSDYP